MGQYFGVILQAVFMSFDFKRGQLESLMGKDQEIPVEACLRNQGYHHCILNTYSFFHCLL